MVAQRRVALVLAIGALGLGLTALFLRRDQQQSAVPARTVVERRSAALGSQGGSEGTSALWKARVLGPGDVDLRSPESNFSAVPDALIRLVSIDGVSSEVQVKTDRLGQFLVDLPPRCRQLTVKIEAKGFDPDVRDVDASKLPGVLYISRDLVHEGSIEGTVRDASTGDPIPGAVCTVTEESDRRAITDAKGIFNLDMAGATFFLSGWKVKIDRAGYAPGLILSARCGQQYDVALYKGLEVSGLVTDELGIPAEGARISVQKCPHVPPHRTGLERTALRSTNQESPSVSAITGRDGRYQLTIPFSPTDSLLVADSKGFVRDMSPCLISRQQTSGTPGSLRYDFRLSRGLTLRGRVQDSTANPVVGVKLWLRPPASDPTWHTGGFATLSQKDGEFILSGLKPILYTGMADPPSSLKARLQSVKVEANPSDSGFVQIVLPRMATKRLVVQLSGGTASRGMVHVTISSTGPSGNEAPISASVMGNDKEVQIEVPAGEYWVTAVASDGSCAEAGPIAVDSAQPGAVDLKLQPGTSAHVRILDREGHAPDPQEIRLERWSEPLKHWVSLSFADPKAGESPLVLPDSSGFRCTVPSGRVRILLKDRVLREFTGEASAPIELGEIVVDR